MTGPRIWQIEDECQFFYRGDASTRAMFVSHASSFCIEYLNSLDTRGKELKTKLGYILKLNAIMALQTLGIYNLVRSGNSFTN